MVVRVLFVCMGNICRSPLAEGVFRAEIYTAGLEAQIEADSGGTGDWHVGDAPHVNSQRVAREHGFSIADLRGRQIETLDFSRFDYLIAMDRQNVEDLKAIGPPSLAHKIKLFMSFAPDAGSVHGPDEIADPYGRDVDAYRDTFILCESAARGLLQYIRLNDLH